jgi:hypothetical protein
MGSLGSAASDASSSASGTLAVIHRELAALQQAKALNEAALREALLKKQQRKLESASQSASAVPRSGGSPIGHFGAARAAWERGIIEDELSKPLEVSEEFIKEMAAKEAATEARLFQGLGKHAESLQALRKRLLEREMAAEHAYAYKAAKEALGPKPLTLEDFGVNIPVPGMTIQGDAGSVGTRGSPSRRSTRSGTHTALSAFTAAEGHVLDSLARLEELEERIADLETRAAGQDIAEMLGISLPIDAGTGSSGASVLRSAYAPLKSSSASTRGGRGLPGAAKSVFSQATSARMGGGGNAALPAVGVAPVLGVVYTRRRTAPQNGMPGKVTYLVESLEEATTRRGYGGQDGGSPVSVGGGRGSFRGSPEAYTYDVDNDPSAFYQRGDSSSPVPGDTGGSSSSSSRGVGGGRDSSLMIGGPLDGDDAYVAGHRASAAGAPTGVAHPVIPVETSDAIDRWLAAKQKQIANVVQAREAESMIKSTLRGSNAAAGGGASVAKGGVPAAAAARGRRAAPGAAPNTIRMAQSVGPTLGGGGGAAGRGRAPVARTGAAADTHKRQAAKTVAVGNNIAKVLQAERARQAAKQRAGGVGRAPPGPGAARVERAGARAAVNRATLSQFNDVRKKFENQKAAVRGAIAGGPKAGSGAAAAGSSGPRPSLSGTTRPAPGAGRSVSNPRGAGSSATAAAGANMRSPQQPTRSTSNPAAGRKPGVGGRPGGPAAAATTTTMRRAPAASPVRAKNPAPAPAPRLGVFGGNGAKPVARAPPATNAAATVAAAAGAPATMTSLATETRLPPSRGKGSFSTRSPLGGRTVQQARANFGAKGVHMGATQKR